MEMREKDTRRKLRCSPANITNLPPELLLEIFSWLSVRDICQRVAPVCRMWGILARHPCLWTELTFSDKDIPASDVCKLLSKSRLLRTLSLRGRHDSDVILREVCESNRLIEELKMESCRGSMRTREVNGNILKRILEDCPKLCNLCLADTLVKNCEFYRLLGLLNDRLKYFRIDDATEEGVRCYLETRTQLHLQRKGILNGESKDVEDMVAMLSQQPNFGVWNIIFTD
jgi:hypothetical protein